MTKLQLDTLTVTSFETADATSDARGTVRGLEVAGIGTPSNIDRTACRCTILPTRIGEAG